MSGRQNATLIATESGTGPSENNLCFQNAWSLGFSNIPNAPTVSMSAPPPGPLPPYPQRQRCLWMADCLAIPPKSQINIELGVRGRRGVNKWIDSEQ